MPFFQSSSSTCRVLLCSLFCSATPCGSCPIFLDAFLCAFCCVIYGAFHFNFCCTLRCASPVLISGGFYCAVSQDTHFSFSESDPCTFCGTHWCAILGTTYCAFRGVHYGSFCCAFHCIIRGANCHRLWLRLCLAFQCIFRCNLTAPFFKLLIVHFVSNSLFLLSFPWFCSLFRLCGPFHCPSVQLSVLLFVLLSLALFAVHFVVLFAMF